MSLELKLSELEAELSRLEANVISKIDNPVLILETISSIKKSIQKLKNIKDIFDIEPSDVLAIAKEIARLCRVVYAVL